MDGPRLLTAAAVPKRRGRRWEIEFTPLTRMQAWAVPEINPGETLQVPGFSFPNEQGETMLRAEFVWLCGRVQPAAPGDGAASVGRRTHARGSHDA